MGAILKLLSSCQPLKPCFRKSLCQDSSRTRSNIQGRGERKMSGGGERKRIVRLLCHSVSKAIEELVVCDEQRIDIGFISRVFGLDPNTLRLNGHFISRGSSDLVSCSVTWHSLLSFFSSRALPTGCSNDNALLVQGKVVKAGTKRAQELDGSGIEIDHPYSSTSTLRRDFNLFKNKKLKSSSLVCTDRNNEVNISNGFSLKRKRQQEDFSALKRLVIK